MPFKIEITETRERITTKREWVKVADSGNEGDGRSVYGYGPEIATTTDVLREVLTQEVDTLDLAAVIRAINNL